MDIERAKTVHGNVMKIALAIEGIQEVTDEDIVTFKSFALDEIVQANRMMSGYKETEEEGGTRYFLASNDTRLAEVYLRVHDPKFLSADQFENICSALDDTFDDTTNGHGVIIDGRGNYSLVKLDCEGDGAEETLLHAGDAVDIHRYAKGLVEAEH